MRRAFALLAVLGLLATGIAPVTALSTPDYRENANSALITSARVPGTIALTSSKRSPVVHGNVPVLANFGSARTSTLSWTRESVVLPSQTGSSQADQLPESPRAPPFSLTSSIE